MRVGSVAGSIVKGRSHGEGDRVAGIFDEVDDVAVVEPRDVVVVHRQDPVAHVEARATLGRTLADDLTCIHCGINGIVGYSIVAMDWNGLEWIEMDWNGLKWIGMD